MSPHALVFVSVVHRPLYDINNKKYMDIKMDQEIANKIRTIHDKEKCKITIGKPRDPLSTDDVLSVKVPWRYKRVDCKVSGITPVQAMQTGDQVWTAIEYCGTWASGLYWKFSSIGVVTDS